MFFLSFLCDDAICVHIHACQARIHVHLLLCVICHLRLPSGRLARSLLCNFGRAYPPRMIHHAVRRHSSIYRPSIRRKRIRTMLCYSTFCSGLVATQSRLSGRGRMYRSQSSLGFARHTTADFYKPYHTGTSEEKKQTQDNSRVVEEIQNIRYDTDTDTGREHEISKFMDRE